MATAKRRIKQPHEVRYLNGRPIDWRRPPAHNKIVGWSKRTTSGKPIRGTFYTLCHLNRLNNLALATFGKEIMVIQPDWNVTVSASAGTHDFDSCWDLWIPGVDPAVQERFFRANGLGGWMRKPPLFSWHYHGFTLPPREGSSVSDDFNVAGIRVGLFVDGGYSTRGRLVASSQISDYYSGKSGLAGHAPDPTWRPRNINASIFRLDLYVERRAKLAA